MPTPGIAVSMSMWNGTIVTTDAHKMCEGSFLYYPRPSLAQGLALLTASIRCDFFELSGEINEELSMAKNQNEIVVHYYQWGLWGGTSPL